MLLKNFLKLNKEDKEKFLDQHLLPIKQNNKKDVFCEDCKFFKQSNTLCQKNENRLNGLVISSVTRDVDIFDHISKDDYFLLHKRISCEHMNSNCRCSYFRKKWFAFLYIVGEF